MKSPDPLTARIRKQELENNQNSVVILNLKPLNPLNPLNLKPLNPKIPYTPKSIRVWYFRVRLHHRVEGTLGEEVRLEELQLAREALCHPGLGL